MSAALRLAPFAPGDGEAAIRILHAAFRDDPCLRHCFVAEAPGYDDRLLGYCEVGHAWHLEAGQGLQLAHRGAEPVGVAYYGLPDSPPDADAGSRLYTALLERCGEEAVARFRAYNRLVDEAAPEGAWASLALLAVSPSCQGQGVGSALLRGLLEACSQQFDCEGLLLDTSTDRNVAFYERHGFEQLARVAVADGLIEHVMGWRAARFR